MKEIDLGTKYGGPMPMEMNESKVRYPVLHVEGPKSLGLPKSGTATIRFNVVSETESRRGNKEHYQCELEVQALSNVKAASNGDNPKSYGKDTEDALDKLRDEKMAEHMEDEGEED